MYPNITSQKIFYLFHHLSTATFFESGSKLLVWKSFPSSLENFPSSSALIRTISADGVFTAWGKFTFNIFRSVPSEYPHIFQD